MERVGRVAYVEEQLERYISLGMLPRGQFASEEKLAGEFNCCRGTVREAFRRLAARGLVVQHPGRKTRAVALDESLTLENLGLALHHRHTEAGRRLLEGFFSLRRQVLVDLLAECCTKASASQVDRLESVCYALSDAARWEPGARCAQLEFELLRLAAHTASRPGHMLLVQSLQRAMRGNAIRLLSLMGGESLSAWARCAMHALNERDVRTIQHQLPALLEACDEGLLDAFSPATRKHSSPATGPDSARDARNCMAEHGPGGLTPAEEEHKTFEVPPAPHAEAVPVETETVSDALLAPTVVSESPDDNGGERVTGNVPGNLLDGRTRACGLSAEADLKPEHPPARDYGRPGGFVREEDEPRHVPLDTPTTSPPD
ncbi:FadR family transcriptional regulator [Corallococcus macrosporus]|uniref:FadR family transcriptional regulator n=1 Tax=Corallococcus macrosporus TaxID=35 RepID=A0ABS3D801_9BACT|nr:GntR family transcriptional regulator [Corallococcus macrosporus]MBN8227789.1 FadR family transcriptional regulator [Corallococcus macrosporus]